MFLITKPLVFIKVFVCVFFTLFLPDVFQVCVCVKRAFTNSFGNYLRYLQVLMIFLFITTTIRFSGPNIGSPISDISSLYFYEIRIYIKKFHKRTCFYKLCHVFFNKKLSVDTSSIKMSLLI